MTDTDHDSTADEVDALLDQTRRQRRFRWRWVIVAAAVVVVFGWAFVAAQSLNRDPTIVRSALLGKPAPAFRLPALDDDATVDFAAMRGDVVIVRAERGQRLTSLAARTPLAANRDRLRVGASAEAGTGWAHVVGSHRVMAYGRLDWLHRRQDTFDGVPVLVGGGHWLYLTPGVAVMVGKGINLQADVKLPVYRHLANRQLDSRAVMQVGVSRSF